MKGIFCNWVCSKYLVPVPRCEEGLWGEPSSGGPSAQVAGTNFYHLCEVLLGKFPALSLLRLFLLYPLLSFSFGRDSPLLDFFCFHRKEEC